MMPPCQHTAFGSFQHPLSARYALFEGSACQPSALACSQGYAGRLSARFGLAASLSAYQSLGGLEGLPYVLEEIYKEVYEADDQVDNELEDLHYDVGDVVERPSPEEHEG